MLRANFKTFREKEREERERERERERQRERERERKIVFYLLGFLEHTHHLQTAYSSRREETQKKEVGERR